jgi:hypothetical protein
MLEQFRTAEPHLHRIVGQCQVLERKQRLLDDPQEGCIFDVRAIPNLSREVSMFALRDELLFGSGGGGGGDLLLESRWERSRSVGDIIFFARVHVGYDQYFERDVP